MLAEAENERMHLMFIEIAQINWFERYLVLFAQMILCCFTQFYM